MCYVLLLKVHFGQTASRRGFGRDFVESLGCGIEEVVVGAVSVAEKFVDTLEPSAVLFVRVELWTEDARECSAVGSTAVGEELLNVVFGCCNGFGVLVGCGGLKFRDEVGAENVGVDYVFGRVEVIGVVGALLFHIGLHKGRLDGRDIAFEALFEEFLSLGTNCSVFAFVGNHVEGLGTLEVSCGIFLVGTEVLDALIVDLEQEIVVGFLSTRVLFDHAFHDLDAVGIESGTFGEWALVEDNLPGFQSFFEILKLNLVAILNQIHDASDAILTVTVFGAVVDTFLGERGQRGHHKASSS